MENKRFFTATDVDCDKRIVYEYDSIPAADFLSNKYDIPKNKLFDFLKEHPLGKILGDEVHVTEIDKINENGSIAYFSKIFNDNSIANVFFIRHYQKQGFSAIFQNGIYVLFY